MTSLARAVAGATALALALGASGCLSNEYRVSRDELTRLANLPPEARGQRVRLVQKVGQRRAPPVDPTQPNQPPLGGGAPAGALPQPDVWDDMEIHPTMGVDVVILSGGGSRPGPYAGPAPRPAIARPTGPMARAVSHGRPVAAVAPPAGRMATTATRVAAAAPAGAAPAVPSSSGVPARPTGALPSSGGGGGGGDGDELVAYAVLAVAVAALAGVGLGMTEGLRYDGDAALSPGQLVYLEGPSGERAVPLGDLHPRDLAGVKTGLVRDDEGYGLYRLGRAPLSRRGYTFKVDVGGAWLAAPERELLTGFASHLQLGYFPHQRFGLLLGATLAGASPRDADPIGRHAFTAEAQLFPLNWRRLHLGLAGNAGLALTSDGRSGLEAPTAGAALLFELALTTRLALTARADLTTTRLTQTWHPSRSLSAGIAIY